MYPHKLKERSNIDLKLRIKSSLPKSLQMISLLYFFWKSSGKKSEIIYGEEKNIEGKIKLELKNSLFDDLKKFFEQKNINISNNLKEIINNNPLFSLQYEPLLVGLELVWKLCKLEFEDSNKPSSIERSGKNRYSKKLKFTKNIEILYHFTKDIIDIDKILYNFLIGNESTLNKSNEEHLKISYALTFITEDAKYLIVDQENNDIVFENLGIYEQLLSENLETNRVKLNSNVEVKGSTRILYNLLEQNMNVYLNYDNKNKIVTLSHLENKHILKFSDYYNLIENFKSITNDIKIIFINAPESSEPTLDEQNNKKLDFQKIVYGAPGTGKSYSLNQQAEKHFENSIKRVTFYDGYTYGQFVGMYKPTVNEKNDIGYSYVPGPFMQQLVQSLKNPKNDFCLIVEEINRAKADKVFGNIFQLLDRDSSGKSRYPVSVSEEQLKFLEIELKEQEEILKEIEEKGLYIPKNLYIWATMNSADEGVQPLDTAFKRRWKFEYISLNKNEKEFEKQRENIKLIIGKNGTSNLEWNEFRKTVNGKLQEYNITEDRLIAPFFISPDDFTIPVSEGVYALDKNILIEKVLMYIFDDLLRHYPKIRNEIFRGNMKTFSNIYEALLNDKSELDNYYEKLSTILSENLFPKLFKEEEDVSEK